MELSKNAIRLLRWLRRHDQWRCIEVLEEQYKHYDYRSFSALKKAGFVDTEVFDYDQPGIDEYGNEFFIESYRISDEFRRFFLFSAQFTGWCFCPSGGRGNSAAFAQQEISASG